MRRTAVFLVLIALAAGCMQAAGRPTAVVAPVPPEAPAWVERTDGATRCVVATYRLRAPRSRDAEDVACHFFLPQDEPCQAIHALRFQPDPTEIVIDAHGRRIVCFRLPRIPAGETAVVRWMARVTTWRTQHHLAPPAGANLAPLAPAVRQLYLADRAPYGINSDHIRKTAADLGPETLSDREVVQAACDHINKHVRYELSGGWDNAATVLKRGTGSCSELAYAFIALCRARGVPARYVGGSMLRAGPPLFFDRAQHRWSEFYLDDLGWVPLDFRMKGYKGDGFYMMPGERLSLGHGDGDAASGSPLGWIYTCNMTARARPQADKEYVWCDDASDETFERIHRLASAAASADAAARRRAVDDLEVTGVPLAVPFLADLLEDGDTGTVPAAARAICRLDEAAGRHYRFAVRDRRDLRKALTEGLEALEPDARRGRVGQWTDLVAGGRPAVPPAGEGPFRAESVDGSPAFTNGDRTGRTLFDYRTGDRCLVALDFTSHGPGQAGLVFAWAGRWCRLRVPMHVPDPPYRERNGLDGVRRSPRGEYGVTADDPHRLVVLVDGFRMRAFLDGKRVIDAGNETVGPGRVGLEVWGKDTRLEVARLRVFEGGESASLVKAMENLAGDTDAGAE